MDDTSRIDRRTFTAAAGAGALILGGVPVGADAARRRRRPLLRRGRFNQGVASGEPGTRGMTVWTRVDGLTRDSRLIVEVSPDEDFRRVVFRQNTAAKVGKDGVVKTRVNKGLKPGERYFYRFEARDNASPIGRFQTLRPADSREPVRIAFFSCQDYQAGYYGAHQAIAREDVDLVICLGDYIYEKNFYEGPRRDTLGANRDGEVMTLPEYRSKYKLYRSDADLQTMHAAHPFMGIWDDHEVEDNYAGTLPGDAADNRRGSFLERRSAGYRAFYEWMPFRRPVNAWTPGFKTLRLGRQADLILLDERRYRSDQPCDDQFFAPCGPAETGGQTLLGPGQKQWFKERLERSQASWKVVANQLMIMALDTAGGAPINKDQWDGYGRERREILSFVRDRGIRDVTFITGDIHTFFAGDVGVDGRGPESVATEFVGGSVTSLGIPELVKESSGGAPLTPDQITALSSQLRTVNPHLRYDEQKSRGYGVLTASENELRVEFKAVNALQRTTTARTIGSFRVGRGDPRVQVL